MSLPLTHGCSAPAEHDAARLREREVDVARRPAEPERRRSDADADGAVRAVRAAVRVGAGNELSRHHQSLLGKVEVEDAVARRRVVRRRQLLRARKRAPDRGLPVVVFAAGEDEVIVGDGRLARVDRVAAGDLIERVNRKRRGAVRCRQQIRVHPQRVAGLQLTPILVDAMRPDDLLGRRHPARERGVGEFDSGRRG